MVKKKRLNIVLVLQFLLLQIIMLNACSIDAVRDASKSSKDNVSIYNIHDTKLNNEVIQSSYPQTLSLPKLYNNSDPNFEYQLGVAYQFGEGIEQDIEKAIGWYTKAATKGSSEAQASLGLIYSNDIYGKKNYQESIKWFEKAAIQNHKLAQFQLGFFFEQGYDRPRDYEKAAFWYTKAAEQEHWPSQYNLGNLYLNELIDVPNHDEIALVWFKKAAYQGSEEAKNIIKELSLKKKSTTPY